MPTKLDSNHTLPNNARKPFKSDGFLSYDDFSTIFDFAYEMTFGKGFHRKNRSGGSKVRTNIDVFIDVFEGKIGEFGVYRHLESQGVTLNEPDCSISGRGTWDSGDFNYLGNSISVKTSKHFAQLLFLEAKDYSIKDDGKVYYKPDNSKHDIIILTRVKHSIEDFLKKNPFQESIYEIKDDLYNSSKVLFEITGYINNKDLANLMTHDFLIRKNEKLNNRIPMDADNYYISAYDMKPKEKLSQTLMKMTQPQKKARKKSSFSMSV